MMQMLAAGGCPILTDNVRTPDESNPRGYLEFEAVKRLRADQTWLTLAVGKAVKIIHLLLRELPVDGRFSYRVIFMNRPIDEVLASQRAMLQREGKKPADESTLTKAFQGQLEQLESWLAGYPCFKVLYLDYHRVLEAPRPSADVMETFLQAGLETEAMAAVVDQSLYRQRAGRIA